MAADLGGGSEGPSGNAVSGPVAQSTTTADTLSGPPAAFAALIKWPATASAESDCRSSSAMNGAGTGPLRPSHFLPDSVAHTMSRKQQRLDTGRESLGIITRHEPR